MRVEVGQQQEPMSTSDLLGLRARLEAWERRAVGDPQTAHHRGLMARYLAGLRTLVETERHDPARAAMLAALALGPRDHGLPGGGDLGPLVQMAAERCGDVVELAIAWGCGWNRVVAPEHEWHGRWVGAVLALSSLAEGSINQSMRWLCRNVQGFTATLRRFGDAEVRERIRSDADEIAVELATGACRCGRPEHQLATWSPGVCRLPAFVATAVRGSAEASLRAGAFATSMLAPLVAEDHLVRVELVEFKVCHVCFRDQIRAAVRERRPIELSAVAQGLSDGGRCPICGTAYDHARTYRAGRKNWLIVPADSGGQYQAVRRYRCRDCGNLFATGRDRCPICDCEVRHPDRFANLWARLGNRDIG
jgi:hypothetical protein